MYAVLGDQDAQEDIRKSNPDTHHCRFLERHSAKFCECLTFHIQGATPEEVYKKGTICPNNPHHLNKELFEEVNTYISLLNKGYYYKTLIELNQVPLIENMTPEEFVVYSAMNTVSRREIIESLQMLGAGMSIVPKA